MIGERTIFSRGSDEWSTPKDLFDSLNEEFHFDLDAASTDENALCERHFTRENDGLLQSWGGCSVWCNPPYSNVKYWVRKAYNERNNAKSIVLLVFSRTDTRWFHDYVYGKAEIRFIKGRLKFSGAKYNAPFPSMLIIYRKVVS